MNMCLAAALALSVSSAPICVKPQTFKLAQSSINCGPAPPPPPGCRVGACACDQNGRNCQWTFICN